MTTHTLQPIQSRQPLVVRLFAQLFSYIFHPLFIPVYATYYLAFIHPGYFVGISGHNKLLVLIRVAYNMVFFPALTILLLKGLGFIKSIFLQTQRERIFGYVAGQIFFFWMYLVFRNQTFIPSILTAFVFGVFISSCVALIVNIYYKVSMHAMGCGGMLGLMLVILYTNPSSPITLPLMLVIFISGLVCTSRLIVSDHTQREIYMGLFWGLCCQFIATSII